MATSKNHYQILGVSRTASTTDIRTAFRNLARTLHPDTATGSAVSSVTISQVNQAWNVLSDPVRRYEYDKTLGYAPGSTSSASTAGTSSSSFHTSFEEHDIQPVYAPARFPWRLMAAIATLAIIGVLVADATSSPAVPGKPDQLLTSGSCVNIDVRNDVYEVSCAAPHDGVVQQLIAIDRSCPPDAGTHRDRQGMGTACVDLVPKDPNVTVATSDFIHG